MGIVGMPNVGKSTLFNCLSKLNVPASKYVRLFDRLRLVCVVCCLAERSFSFARRNFCAWLSFAFCTIDPNVARVPVPDERFDWLCANVHHNGEVPACLTIYDIAGLIQGASTGAGLGNNFLSHIAEVDGIYHVVRAFDDESVSHENGSVDPTRDLEIIRAELRAKDAQIVAKQLEAFRKKRIKSNEGEMLEKIGTTLETTEIRFATWTNKEIEFLNTLQLLTAKPAIVLVNLSETDYLRKKNKWLKPLHEYMAANMPGEIMIPFSGAMERMLQQMTPEQVTQWLTENNAKSAIDKILKCGYEQLGLIHYFTVGEIEVRCWTIQRGTKAPQAAGVIHSDFEDRFICGDVMSFADFKEHGSEAAVRAAGKMVQVGKTYEMEDGLICHWKCGRG